jgi:hypothetical protein
LHPVDRRRTSATENWNPFALGEAIHAVKAINHLTDYAGGAHQQKPRKIEGKTMRTEEKTWAC